MDYEPVDYPSVDDKSMTDVSGASSFSPPSVLWLSVSPHLRQFDQRLIQHLSRATPVLEWDYEQTADEPCCFEAAIALLHDYVRSQSHPVHLVGHGTSGILAQQYAQQYASQVASVTLLSVGPEPTVNWQSHYYALRNLLPCRRSIVLMQLARVLFGPYDSSILAALAQRLERELDESLSPHSLAQVTSLRSEAMRSELLTPSPQPPLLVCYGERDSIHQGNLQHQWQARLQKGDRLWVCPDGRHFFHYDYPSRVASVIADHWQAAQPAFSVLTSVH